MEISIAVEIFYRISKDNQICLGKTQVTESAPKMEKKRNEKVQENEVHDSMIEEIQTCKTFVN